MELKEFGILEKTIYGIGLKKLGILKTTIYGSIPYVYPLHLNYPPLPFKYHVYKIFSRFKTMKQFLEIVNVFIKHTSCQKSGL